MEQREEKNPIRNGVRNGMFFTLALVMARELAQKISLFAIKLYCYKIAKLQKYYMIRNGQHPRQRIIVRHVLVNSVADKNEQTKNR